MKIIFDFSCGPPRKLASSCCLRSSRFPCTTHNTSRWGGVGHNFLLCLLIKMFFPAGKSALHWAAAVNNVEATLLLLKNGANRDMQDNKVQSGL